MASTREFPNTLLIWHVASISSLKIWIWFSKIWFTNFMRSGYPVKSFTSRLELKIFLKEWWTRFLRTPDKSTLGICFLTSSNFFARPTSGISPVNGVSASIGLRQANVSLYRAKIWVRTLASTSLPLQAITGTSSWLRLLTRVWNLWGKAWKSNGAGGVFYTPLELL